MDFFPPVWLVTSLEWVQTTTGFPDFVNDHGWTWAAAEAVHFVGLCLLLGTIGAWDLRLLGVVKALPIGPLERLIPWSWVGFGICVVTGLFFVVGNFWSANAYLNNMAFQWKMVMISLAGVNVLVFNLMGTARAVSSLGAGASTPLGARIAGGASLFLWLSVIFWGRFLPILGDAF